MTLMTITERQALAAKFDAQVRAKFPSLILDDDLTKILVNFLNRCQEANPPITPTIENLNQCVEANQNYLNWTGAAITEAVNAEKAKTAELARRRLREALGYVHHTTELDRVSQSERTGQGEGAKSESASSAAKRMLQSRTNHRQQLELDNLISTESFNYNKAEQARRKETLLKAVQGKNFEDAKAAVKAASKAFKD
jgi:hypothetical protein